jgi:hypothetical protein
MRLEKSLHCTDQIEEQLGKRSKIVKVVEGTLNVIVVSSLLLMMSANDFDCSEEPAIFVQLTSQFPNETFALNTL